MSNHGEPSSIRKLSSLYLSKNPNQLSPFWFRHRKHTDNDHIWWKQEDVRSQTAPAMRKDKTFRFSSLTDEFYYLNK